MEAKPRYAPVPHLNVRRHMHQRSVLTHTHRSTSRAITIGDLIRSPTLAQCGARVVPLSPTHFVRFRCEEEFVLVNIVRNNKHVRGLSGAIAAPVASEGNE